MGVKGRDRSKGPERATVGALLHLVLVEIDNFAALRRSLGVQRADLLVLDMAERFAALAPDTEVVTTGRNLIELTLVAKDHASLDKLVGKLHADCEQPQSIGGNGHHVHLVIGTATATSTHLDEIALIEQAEQSLARARAEKSTLPNVDPAPVVMDDAMIAQELRAAIARDELFVQYQPKLHLRRQEISSVEALIRWHHPQRGLVLPNDFIPAAERTGDIAGLTLWTLKQVIADQRVLRRNGHDLPVFVNMAGVLLSDKQFVAEVIALIENSGARLGIEITETSVIGDPQGAIAHLKRLSEIGAVITIDDYGAGLSSLAYLKQLPAGELKIDKLFVTQLSSSHRDPLIVRSTIDLAHALEMEVVAEGVETPASLALLSVMGCDMVQGFLISRPLALESLLSFLRDTKPAAIIEAAKRPWERFAAVRARA